MVKLSELEQIAQGLITMKGFYLAVAMLFFLASWWTRNVQTAATAHPELINTCLITGRFTELVDFYQNILGISPRVSDGAYAEFPTDAGVLAIFTAEAQ